MSRFRYPEKLSGETYVSRTPKIHEEKYPTYDLELAAFVFALKVCHHYLEDILRACVLESGGN